MPFWFVDWVSAMRGRQFRPFAPKRSQRQRRRQRRRMG